MLLLVCKGHSMLSFFPFFSSSFFMVLRTIFFLDQSEGTLKRASWFSAARLNNGGSHWKCLVTCVMFLTDDSVSLLIPN